MSRIIVLCEGDTEELAVRHFVARQWKSDGFGPVGLQHHNLKGKTQNAGKIARLYLDEREVLAVFTLVDLQGTIQVVHQTQDGLDAKVQRVRTWLRGQVTHSRASQFFPHVCVHQIEAWILAEGRQLAERLGDSQIGPDGDAELKDFQNPPSKRLNELFLRCKSRRYNKKADGTPLFKAMQFGAVYKSCQYFREFYDDLKAVGQR